MSSKIDFFKPCQEQHSIKEAVLTVFLQNPIIKPSSFKKLLEADEFKQNFQEFQILKQVKVMVQSGGENKAPNIDHNTVDDKGFVFNQFKGVEKIAVLQGLNDISRRFFSFHHFRYENWGSFVSDFKAYLTALNSFQKGIYVVGYGLHYIDEFTWELSEALPVREVFNEKSSILPPVFFSSDFQQYAIVNKSNENVLDRLEIIKVESNGLTRVSISHSISELCRETIALDHLLNDNLTSVWESSHQENKNLLKQILSQTVLEKINLTT